MEKKRLKNEKWEEGSKTRSIDHKKNRSVFNIGMTVAGGVAAVLSATSARTETLEDRLGNIENYRNTEFVGNPETTGVAWCTVHGNTLRWLPFDRANLDTPTPVLERDFLPQYPPNITFTSEERIIHEPDSDRGYWTSFDTNMGNRFEWVGMRPTSILYRNSENFVEDLNSRNPWLVGAFTSSFWRNQICMVVDGPNRGGTIDSGDIRCINEMESEIPIADVDFHSRTTRRTDLNPDPVETDRVNIVSSFACTENHCFVSQGISEGFREVTPTRIHVCDRSPDDQCINQQLLSNDPNLVGVQCAFEDPDSIILFVRQNASELWYAAYLKDADEDGMPNLADNCPSIPNPADDFGRQQNSDEDSLGDACDKCPRDSLSGGTDDPDNDNVCNRIGNDSLGTIGDDNCPTVSNPDQLDSDSDRRGDACDSCPLDRENDRDRDGLCGDVDPCPTDRTNEDPDQDTLCGFDDVCPLDPNNDEDQDFLCANEDPCPTDFANKDEDRDGLCDNVNDPCIGDPNNLDADNDGLCDRLNDPCLNDSQNRDTDGDGMCDPMDNCMVVPNEHQENTFGNEQGDACERRPETSDGGTQDGGITDEPDAGISEDKPDAATLSNPDAANRNTERDAGVERTDTKTNSSEPPKDGCVDCNQTGKTPESLIALFGLALSRMFRKRKSSQ